MSAYTPLVSVIIPTYNRSDLLERAVRSVLNQTLSDIEIIVVNDCGIPVESLLHHLDAGQGKIVSIRAARNSGRGAVRNLGLKIAAGKYIAYLDDDDYYYPNHLETLAHYLESSQQKVAYTDSLNATQQLKNGQWVTVETNLHYSYDFDYDHIFINNYIPTLCIMHARECLEKTGLFDESLHTQEDWDMWLRLSLYYTFHHIKQVTSEYTNRLGEVSQSRTDPKADFYETTQRIYEKYASYVQDKPLVQAKQQAWLRTTHDAYEKAQGEKVGQFVQGIMEKLEAQDPRAAMVYYKEFRQKVNFERYAHELGRIDDLMEKIQRRV